MFGELWFFLGGVLFFWGELWFSAEGSSLHGTLSLSLNPETATIVLGTRCSQTLKTLNPYIYKPQSAFRQQTLISIKPAAYR